MDVRAGVIPVQNKKVIIALGNAAVLDNFTNVITTVNAVINALIERKGCVHQQIWICSLLPRLGADEAQNKVLIQQNKGLAKSVRALIRRKQFPLKFITAHKWLLRRMVDEDGTSEVEPDGIFYEENGNLNQHGLEHLHLLLAKEVQLREIRYSWDKMPTIKRITHKRVINRDVAGGNRQPFADLQNRV